ncbi:uncharacterized protein LOC120155962 [Hibiscus syriacus]|uniref:uncharacterized protein LOC120155962 n=1 Tax=Hibiscus syriacus TaxID=106335 RepID=UPI00192235B3|nr:uncharacterized protein LOC120155962 [Hibiscus syriacus]
MKDEGARVSWDLVCRPNHEWGLRLQNLIDWNKTSMFQHVWALVSNVGTLWVRWTNEYILKGKSFMAFEPTSSYSWFWRKILKLRAVAGQFLDPASGGFSGQYKVNEVWKVIRRKYERESWAGLIWFPLHIPRFAMITWFALFDRLPTRDRLLKLGLVVASECVLCSSDLETRDHLFFNCVFSKEVWGGILQICNLSRSVGGWSQEVLWAVAELKGRSLIITLLKLAGNAYVYRILNERNCRVFGGSRSTVGDLICRIMEDIRFRLVGSAIRGAGQNADICVEWGIG